MKLGALICEDVAACGPMRSFGAFCDRGCIRLFFWTAKDAKERKGRQGKSQFFLASFASLGVLCAPSYAAGGPPNPRRPAPVPQGGSQPPWGGPAASEARSSAPRARALAASS